MTHLRPETILDYRKQFFQNPDLKSIIDPWGVPHSRFEIEHLYYDLAEDPPEYEIISILREGIMNVANFTGTPEEYSTRRFL